MSLPPRLLLVLVAAALPGATLACSGSSSRSHGGTTTPTNNNPPAATAPQLVSTFPASGQRLGPTDPLLAVFDVALIGTSVPPAVTVIESGTTTAVVKSGTAALAAPEAVAFLPDLPWALDSNAELRISTALTSVDDLRLVTAQTIVRSTTPTSELFTSPHFGSSAGVALLGSGQVLVSGGNVGGTVGAIATSSLVDATGAVTTAGSMLLPRFGHVAVRLADGRVAVVGGQSSTVLYTTVELYDPVTNTWSAGATGLALRTTLHRVVPLADGRWLVLGGYMNTAQSVPQPVMEVLSADMSSVAALATQTTLGGSVAVLPSGDAVLFGNDATVPTDDLEVVKIDATNPAVSVVVTKLLNVLQAPAGSTTTWAHPSVVEFPGGDGRILVQVADATCVVTVTLNGVNPPTAVGVPGPALLGRGRTFTKLVPTPDGSILIGPGGRSPGASGTDPFADLYRPGAPGAAGTALPLTLKKGRRSAGVAVVGDGRILLVGGREGGLSGPLHTGANVLEVVSHEALILHSLGTSRRTIGIGVAPASGSQIAPTSRTFTFSLSGALDASTVGLSQAVTATVNGGAVSASATLTSPRALTFTLASNVTLTAGQTVEVRLGNVLRDAEGRLLELSRGVAGGEWTVRP